MPASPNLIAGGNISPSRFVKQDATADFQALQATANSPLIGISHEGTRMPPGVDGSDGFHARTGESVGLYGDGDECLVQLGGTVAADDWLVSDANGKAIALSIAGAGGTHYYGAKALENGVLDELVRVKIVIGVFKVV